MDHDLVRSIKGVLDCLVLKGERLEKRVVKLEAADHDVLPLSLKEAVDRRACRICGGKVTHPFEYDWGKEHAHSQCVKAERITKEREKVADDDNPFVPMTVTEAQRRHVCRICQKDDNGAKDMAWSAGGKAEYAHKSCLWPEKSTDGRRTITRKEAIDAGLQYQRDMEAARNEGDGTSEPKWWRDERVQALVPRVYDETAPITWDYPMDDDREAWLALADAIVEDAQLTLTVSADDCNAVIDLKFERDKIRQKALNDAADDLLRQARITEEMYAVAQEVQYEHEQLALTNAASTIRRLAEKDEPAPNDAVAKEQERRAYYQSIVHTICNYIDEYRLDGSKIVCGTADEPTDDLQRAVADLVTDRRAARTAAFNDAADVCRGYIQKYVSGGTGISALCDAESDIRQLAKKNDA